MSDQQFKARDIMSRNIGPKKDINPNSMFDNIDMKNQFFFITWALVIISTILFTVFRSLNITANNAKAMPFIALLFAIVGLMIITFFEEVKMGHRNQSLTGILSNTLMGWVPGLFIISQIFLILKLLGTHYHKTNFQTLYGFLSGLLIIIQIFMYIFYTYSKYINPLKKTGLRALKDSFLLFYPWFLATFIGFSLTVWFYFYTTQIVTDDGGKLL